MLEDKTETLRSEAATFQRQAVSLKRSMWWRNMKLKLLCGFIVVIVLAYLLLPMLGNLPGFSGGSEGEAESESESTAGTSDEPSKDGAGDEVGSNSSPGTVGR